MKKVCLSMLTLMFCLFSAAHAGYIEIDMFASSGNTSDWEIHLSDDISIEDSCKRYMNAGLGFVTKSSLTYKEELVFSKFDVVVIGGVTGLINMKKITSTRHNLIIIFVGKARAFLEVKNDCKVIVTGNKDIAVSEIIEQEYSKLSLESDKTRLLAPQQINSSSSFLNNCCTVL
jgi:hypothetical protein